MARRRSGWTDEERHEVLEDLEASGLTVAAFARERGFSSWTLYEWRRRLGKSEERAEEPRDFVPVRVVRDSVPSAPIEVSLGNGVRMSVPSGFDSGELHRLVEVLLTC